MSDQAGPQGGEQLQLPTAPELVLSTAQLAISLAAAAIAQRQELEQAQLAIDTADALLPLIARLLPEEQVRQFRRAVAELQLAYAEAVRTPASGEEPTDQEPPADEPKVEAPPRPKIWTPGGDV
ncbi:MAG TPA: hypothetical protein VFJ66_06260 [Gaiellales bacterium]|nr:hypothetical protein [Gaiellales bacterium]